MGNTVANAVNDVVEANTSLYSASTPGSTTPNYPKQKTTEEMDREHQMAAKRAKREEESIDKYKEKLKYKNMSCRYDVDLFTCKLTINTTCTRCDRIIYEEDIIAGFNSGESDYNT